MKLALLDAGLLAGLAAVVLPTLIHLISRRRARRVRFAPMALLMRSQKRTARSIRLRQLLLLLVRTLFIFAIAAAVLRPLLTDEPIAGTTTAPVVVVVPVADPLKVDPPPTRPLPPTRSSTTSSSMTRPTLPANAGS